MGERANFIIEQREVGEPPVVIYTHWGGTWRRHLAVECIEAARGRLGDPHYFTALFIAKLHELGYLSGVGTSLDDNSYPITVVSSQTGEIQELSEIEAERWLKQYRNDRLGTALTDVTLPAWFR
jgi:hypothetical protein